MMMTAMGVCGGCRGKNDTLDSSASFLLLALHLRTGQPANVRLSVRTTVAEKNWYIKVEKLNDHFSGPISECLNERGP